MNSGENSKHSWSQATADRVEKRRAERAMQRRHARRHVPAYAWLLSIGQVDLALDAAVASYWGNRDQHV